MLEVNDSNFEEIIIQANKPAVIDFWAEWCGPCRMIGPYIAELAEEYSDKVVVAKVNVDECPGITAKYAVRNIPTVLFIKGGQVVEKQVGAAQKSAFKAKIDAML